MTEFLKINVLFADNKERLFAIEPRLSVYLFKRHVAQSIDIKDEKYFGFYFQDDKRDIYWLPDEKNILYYDFLRRASNKIELYFRLKYFPPYDYRLVDEITQNLIYFQLRQELFDGNFECDADLCFQLLAMTLLLNEDQLTSVDDIKKMNLIPAYLFAKHPSVDYCANQIKMKFDELESFSKDDILRKFMISILEIPYQLTHIFPAKTFSSSVVYIAITSNGFSESDQLNKSSIKLSYSWSDITNISHHKSRVNIDIQDPSHKSSIRRKSSALGIYYDLYNPNLAKSFVYLAKDTLNYVSHSYECKTIMSTTTPRRNPNALKKNANTFSGNKEKVRPSTQNVFVPDTEVVISRSSSRISLTSSIYAGSGITNDSTSLQMDDDLNTPINLKEKKVLFLKLNEARKSVAAELDKKIKEAVQYCIMEENITKKMPNDINVIDPKRQIKLTKFTITTQCDDENSAFQNEKNIILREIDTLQNIIKKLKENEKKHRIEIAKKETELKNCIKKVKELEEQNALQSFALAKSRSNSEGCLYPYSNGKTPVMSNGHVSYNNPNEAPLTEPRSRKNGMAIINRNSSGSETVKAFNLQYQRMSKLDELDSIQSTSNSTIPYQNSDIRSPSQTCNSSTFQRFSSHRSLIKVQNKIITKPPTQSNYETNNSNSSIESNSSINNSDSKYSREDIDSNSDIEFPNEKYMSSRKSSDSSNIKINYRDSKEINMHRAPHKVSNMKIKSRLIPVKNLQKNRNSVSLEELREDLSEISEPPKLYSFKPRKESNESINSGNKFIYHPSKRDGRSQLVTRGKQPSIIRKAAKPSVVLDR